MVGFEEALALVLENSLPGPAEAISLVDAAGRFLAEDVYSTVDSPSLDTSLKDGYAVVSDDISDASQKSPVELEIIGFTAAGDGPGATLSSGFAVRVTTGAVIPQGAQGILAKEFTEEKDGRLICLNNAEPGRNILPAGADIASGRKTSHKGDRAHPALIGLLAAAGVDMVSVYPKPRVCVLATGDEVVLPGRPLAPGQLYASNIMETISWLKQTDLAEVVFFTAPDDLEKIKNTISRALPRADAFITSGGAWQSERDLTAEAFNRLGWREIFRRVRLGPGKATGFGVLENKPVFVLSGGPPSFEAGFLELAMPGIYAMNGSHKAAFPLVTASLEEPLKGHGKWTKVIHASLTADKGILWVKPLLTTSRLISMAGKNALILLPEKETVYEKGDQAPVQILRLEDF